MNIHTIRCASCHRRVAYSASEVATRNAVYCDKWCIGEPSITPMEERNDQWRALVAHGKSPIAVARLYDVHHPLIYKVLSKD